MKGAKMRQSTIHFLVMAVIAGLTCLLTASVDAVSIDTNLVGKLDQALTDYPLQGCGPTAAANSFTFLQNQYPQIYGNMLVPAGGAIGAANELGRNMHTSESNGGTTWTNFLLGKAQYLQLHAPGTTIIKGMYDPDAGLPVTGFPGVIEGNPSPAYFLNELQDKEDIEILWRDPDHWVTVTGFTWNPTMGGGTGTIDYFDPQGGILVTGMKLNQTGTDNPLFAGLSEIGVAISESPVPEPSTTWLLLLSGLGGLLGYGRWERRRAVD
jgi:hypothetical protein